MQAGDVTKRSLQLGAGARPLRELSRNGQQLIQRAMQHFGDFRQLQEKGLGTVEIDAANLADGPLPELLTRVDLGDRWRCTAVRTDLPDDPGAPTPTLNLAETKAEASRQG